MRSRVILLGLILTGCASAQTREPGPVPDSLHCTVKRIALEGDWETPLLFHCEAKFKSGEETLSAPCLTIAPDKWGRIMITDASSDGEVVAWGWHHGGPCLDMDNIPAAGIFLAVRCQDGEEGHILAEVRAYHVEGGELLSFWDVKQHFADGEERAFRR
jgi:hypothetical protein